MNKVVSYLQDAWKSIKEIASLGGFIFMALTPFIILDMIKHITTTLLHIMMLITLLFWDFNYRNNDY